MNMTHTGELGYVFYIPNEFALHVYDSILESGKGGHNIDISSLD
jgi:pyruvate dehydrogenase phosphatase regulatory subunit